MDPRTITFKAEGSDFDKLRARALDEGYGEGQFGDWIMVQLLGRRSGALLEENGSSKPDEPDMLPNLDIAS